MEERQLLDDLGHWAETLFAASQLSQSQRTLATALEEAQRERMVDPALHIWSQSAIVDILEREARRAVRQHHPLSVLLMEVNQTDSIGERGGQAAGESLLEDIAQTIRVALRPYDAVGRYGSGEFLVVLPDSDRCAAAAVTQRLRERIERSAFAAGHDRASCTLRSGAAWLAPHADACSAESLVACADHALGHARETGGSLVEADASTAQGHYLPSWPASSTASGDEDLPGSTHIAAKLHRMRAWAAED
jgi:diguanylate cyclase (GGDEF)-like protein